MKINNYLTTLTCPSCNKQFSPNQVQTFCHDCNSPLLAEYDLQKAKDSLDRDELSHRPKGMWRWSELLPVQDSSNVISLGEGDTPLLSLLNISKDLGINKLFIKDESLNPTGSFKARGLSASVSKAAENGIQKIVIPSAGNAGGALAAYASRTGIQSLIYMPKSSPYANIFESQIMGAKVELVDGLISDAAKLAQEDSLNNGWFNMATFKEPYRVEGKKIMGYEIAEQLKWKLPDVILYPTGGGTGLVGMWKAFLEMEALGWLNENRKPRMIAVQAEGCAPVVKAFIQNQEKCDFWQNATTIASGLCVPNSFADRLILKYIRQSNGAAIDVSDSEIIDSQYYLAHREGIFTCPEGAATFAGLKKLINLGMIDKDETIILFNTGSGLKYIR